MEDWGKHLVGVMKDICINETIMALTIEETIAADSGLFL
jgi:hypothetical protein